jgi:6-pyruvoyltetrahydropterin/6-carboxytetrahydropterin synthase
MHILRLQRGLTAIHALTLQDGLQEPLHEHHWRVEVQVSSEDLDEISTVMDFRDLLRDVDAVLDPLQGRALNALPAFAGKNPSSEVLVAHLFAAIAPLLPRRVRLDEVTVVRDGDVVMSFSYRASR